jgi:multisubunit Na+/H+ antiporter MnhG subunit
MRALDDIRKKVKPDKGEWPYVILGIFLFFGSIFLFVAEIDDFQYTISLNLFMTIFAVIGLLLAIVLSLYYGKGTKGVERLRLTLLFVIFLTLIVPIWAHFINRIASVQTITKNLEIFDNSLYQSPDIVASIDRVKVKKDGFYLFLVDDSSLLKVHTKSPEFIALKAGDFLNVKIKRGLLGFKFVDRQMFE